MPTDACQFFYDCKGCGERLKPNPGDCCVFCSYGSVPCPPIQIAEDNERTNSMGLFNYAEAYWRGAQALAAKNLKGGHADSPVRTLYYHAIELYLKALLRQHYSVDDLQNKFRHSIKRMRAKAERNGLCLMDEDREVLALMKGDVLIRARYIRTGFFTFPTLEALDRTCKSLRESVGKLLREAGVKVRL